MFVALGRVELHIPSARSLKDKRRVVQSVATRVRNQFRVAISEVEAAENWNLAVLGIAAVSNQAGHAQDVVDHVIRYLDTTRLDADVGAVERDMVSAF